MRGSLLSCLLNLFLLGSSQNSGFKAVAGRGGVGGREAVLADRAGIARAGSPGVRLDQPSAVAIETGSSVGS